VWPASYNPLAALFKFLSKSISFGSEPAKEGERDQVGRGVKVNLFDLLVDNPDLVVRRSDRS
jgi:hypothetical protein